MNNNTKTYSLLVLLIISLLSCNNQSNITDIQDNIPSLEELSGVWVSTDTVAMEPSIRNLRAQALVNRDLTSISWFASAPYSGGYHTGALKLNNKTPKVSKFRWQPHQALRFGEIDRWSVLSSTRMLFEKDAVMWKIEITNTDAEARDLQIGLDMIGFISKYSEDWQWWYPYPKMDGKTTKRDAEIVNIRKYIGTGITEKERVHIKRIKGVPTPIKTTITWPTDEDILNSTKYSAKSKS